MSNKIKCAIKFVRALLTNFHIKIFGLKEDKIENLLWNSDACKMHTWTLHFVNMFSHIFASYIMLYPCFTLIFGDLPMIPFILVITLQGQKSLFFMFFMFQDPNGVKKSSSSGNINFYPREPTWARRRSKTGPGGPQDQGPRAHPPGARGAPS